MNESRSGDPPAEPMNGRLKHTDRPATRFILFNHGPEFFNLSPSCLLWGFYLTFFFCSSFNHGITVSIFCECLFLHKCGDEIIYSHFDFHY